jgi:hypothetical protein
MTFNKDKYRYVDHTPKNSDVREIIALASYCGSVVKGSAKCDPRDSFNSNVGETLAALRCNFKVAEKRLHNSQDKVIEAQAKVEAAMKELEKATKYHDHAQKEYDEASKLLVDYETSLN